MKSNAPQGQAAAPKTLRVPMTNVFDGNDYSATILIGSNQVSANVILDTGSSTLAVTPSVYNAAKDTAMSATSLGQIVQYGTGAWVGPVVDTQVALQGVGGSVGLSKTSIALTVSQAPDDFDGTDGILGLAYLSMNQAYDFTADLKTLGQNPPVTFPWPFPDSNFQTSWDSFVELIKSKKVKPTNLDPYFSQLEEQGVTQNKFAFYALRSWVRMATKNQSAIAQDPWNNGFLILGGGEEQTDLYSGNFVDVDVLHDVYYNTNLISITVGNGQPIPVAPLQPQYKSAVSNSIIDTGTNPLALANELFNKLINALQAINPHFITMIEQAAKGGISSALVDLAEWPVIGFTLTGADQNPVTLTVSPNTYWQDNYPGAGLSVFQIQPLGPKTPMNQSILGLPLMNNYYTVFDRSQGAGNGIVRFAPIKLPQGI